MAAAGGEPSSHNTDELFKNFISEVRSSRPKFGRDVFCGSLVGASREVSCSASAGVLGRRPGKHEHQLVATC